MKLFTMAAAALSFFSRSTDDALSYNVAPVAVFPDFVPYTCSTHTNNTYAHSMYNDVDNNEINLNRMMAVFAAIMAAADLATVCIKKRNKKETTEALSPSLVAVPVQPVVPVFTTLNEQAIEQANRRMAVAAQTIEKAEAARQASKNNAPQEQIREGAAHYYFSAFR